MGFLTDLFGGSGNSFWTISLSLIIVLILIVIGVWLLKVIFNASGKVTRGRNRRLAIIDAIPVDAKRTMILVRRDNVEHLIITSPAGDAVVETGISVDPRNYVAAATPTTPQTAQKATGSALISDDQTPAERPSTENEEQSKPRRAVETASRLGLTGLLRRRNAVERDRGTADQEQAIQSQPTEPSQALRQPEPRQAAPMGMTPTAVQEPASPSLRHTGLLRASEGGEASGSSSTGAPAPSRSIQTTPVLVENPAISEGETTAKPVQENSGNSAEYRTPPPAALRPPEPAAEKSTPALRTYFSRFAGKRKNDAETKNATDVKDAENGAESKTETKSAAETSNQLDENSASEAPTRQSNLQQSSPPQSTFDSDLSVIQQATASSREPAQGGPSDGDKGEGERNTNNYAHDSFDNETNANNQTHYDQTERLSHTDETPASSHQQTPDDVTPQDHEAAPEILSVAPSVAEQETVSAPAPSRVSSFEARQERADRPRLFRSSSRTEHSAERSSEKPVRPERSRLQRYEQDAEEQVSNVSAAADEAVSDLDHLSNQVSANLDKISEQLPTELTDMPDHMTSAPPLRRTNLLHASNNSGATPDRANAETENRVQDRDKQTSLNADSDTNSFEQSDADAMATIEEGMASTEEGMTSDSPDTERSGQSSQSQGRARD